MESEMKTKHNRREAITEITEKNLDKMQYSPKTNYSQ